MEGWSSEPTLGTPAQPRREVWSLVTNSVGLARSGPEVSSRDGDEPLAPPVTALVGLLDRVMNTEGGTLTLATLPTRTAQTTLSALARACLAAQVALDHKGKDILVLDM